jgi:hypothetical protein
MSRLAAATVLFSLLELAPQDPRSVVLVVSDCRTETSRRELTLFANGTMRLLDGLGATRTMRLVELGRAELEAYVNRFAEIPFDDMAPQLEGLEGDLVESCRLELAVPGHEHRAFIYEQFDTLSLGLRHALLVVDDLFLEFETAREIASRPRAYEPEIGDVLVRRLDGARFEVRGFSVEGSGIELEGLEQPVTLFILKDSLLDEFDPADVGEDR